MKLLAIVLLTAIWVALWRVPSLGTVLSGLAVATAIVLLVGTPRLRGSATVHPVPAVRYLLRFAVDLVKASAIVAWEVVTPTDRTSPGIVDVPITGGSDAVTTIVANTISLVPGTLTVDARREPPLLRVHVLHLQDPERVRADVRELERMAIAAFGRAPVPEREEPGP